MTRPLRSLLGILACSLVALPSLAQTPTQRVRGTIKSVGDHILTVDRKSVV